VNTEKSYGVLWPNGTLAPITAASEEGLREMLADMFGLNAEHLTKTFVRENLKIVEVNITLATTAQ